MSLLDIRPAPARRRPAVAPPQPGRSVEAGVLAALAVLLLVVLFANDWGVFVYDTKPELYQAPWRTLQRELSAWRPSPHLGQANYHVGFAPIVFVVGLIRALGAEPWVASRLLRFALLLIGAWGALRLLDGLAGERSGAVARVTAAVVWVANPYAIVSGATLPVLLPSAFLPWLLLAFTASLRRPGWRGPARFALVFFLMGGLNAGVVPLLLLLALPCLMVYLRIAEGVAVRAQLAALVRCGLLSLAVSAYWLVPTLLAAGSGTDVAANTERPEVVAGTSSAAESLRLLGMWTMYGQWNGRLFTPAFAGYLTNLLAVVATFAVPVAAAAAALVSRSRVRLASALLLAVSVPVMVGMFPPDAPSPFGRGLALAFERVPGAIAFRTTNKAGALAALGVTLLLAVGAEELVRRARSWRATARTAALVALGLGVAGATLPAWTGDLYPTALPIPGYWQEAAADLNAGDGGRVLFVPGQALARYRWGHEGVDDLDASLVERPFVWRPTVPAGSRAAANFLAALDVPLNEGALGHGVLPAFARYMGATEVLLRNDTEWELVDGARPAVLAEAVTADPELQPIDVYGERGAFTVAPPEVVLGRAEPVEEVLPPLQRFAVTDPLPIVRAEAVGGALLVDGDNFGLPALSETGLLAGEPAYRFLAGMDPDTFAQSLADGGRVVQTDTNRRREWHAQHTSSAFTPTLSADAPVDPAVSRVLFPGADAQTVTVTEGGSVTASGHGSPFYPAPYGHPALAVDEDPGTAWTVGGFNTAVGQSLTVVLDRPRVVRRLTLDALQTSGVSIAGVRVRLGERVVLRALPAAGPVELDLPPTRTGTVTVEIAEVRGEGQNPVGIREVAIPGVAIERFARLPRTLTQLADTLDQDGRRALAAAPLDVVLTRQAGDPDDPGDDEEGRLAREFSLPDDRSFTISGEGRAAASLPDDVLDRLAGTPPEVTATGTSRLDGDPGVRASKALDGDPGTAWVPAEGDQRPAIELRFPPQILDGVEIDQRGGEGRITEVELDLGTGQPVRASLDGAVDRVAFPARLARQVRLTVLGTSGGGVRVAELGVGLVTLPPPPPDALLGCAPLFEVDGEPVDVAFGPATVADLEGGAPLPLTTCEGHTLALPAGTHRLRSLDGWTVDTLRLASGGSRAPAPRAAPGVTVVSSSATSLVLDVGAADAPFYLVTGQAFDERWEATLGGRSLGPPLLVDGYAVGWRIEPGEERRVVVRFAPQRALVATRGASAAALVACGVLALPWHTARSPARAVEPLARRRRWLWAAAPVVLALLLGWAGVVLGAGLAAWHWWRAPAPATLLRLAVALLAAVPVAWLLRGLPSEDEVGPALVSEHLAPHWLAAAGLVFLVLGVWRATRE